MKRFLSFLTVFPLMVFAFPAFADEPATSKSAARAEVDRALDRVEIQIKTLETKTKELSKDAQTEWQSAIDDLKKNGRKLRDEIKEERTTGETKAKDFWSRIKSAVGELQAGVESAAKKLKEKPEAKK